MSATHVIRLQPQAIAEDGTAKPKGAEVRLFARQIVPLPEDAVLLILDPTEPASGDIPENEYVRTAGLGPRDGKYLVGHTLLGAHRVEVELQPADFG